MARPPFPEFDELVLGMVRAARRGAAPAAPLLTFIPDGRVWTYAQFDDDVNRLANGLARLGVSKGAHVGLMMNNCPEYLLSVCALAKLGAVCVPYNVSLFGDLLAYAVADSAIETVIAGARYMETLLELSEPSRASIKTWITADPGGSPVAVAQAQCTTLHGVAAAEVPEAPDVVVTPQDRLIVMYTSGTTGPSKGVVSSHSHPLWVSALTAERYLRLRTDDTFYVSMPLFHAGALWFQCGATMWAGGHIALTGGFSASRFWPEIAEVKATATMIIMSMAAILDKLPRTEAEAANTIRVAWVVPPPLDRAGFEERYGMRIATHYGLTEITPATVGFLDEDWPRGSSGAPVEEMDVIIADEYDRELPRGSVGEILVRPKRAGVIFQGYFRKADATVDLWRNLWFHTGDRAYMDEDRYLYFVDRAKDAIRRRGENVSAQEVEGAIAAHDDILEVAAVPVPADIGEDEICVCVVRREGSALTEREIFAFAQSKLPYFMVPRYVDFVDELPKTQNLKVQKFVLREHASNRIGQMWDCEEHGLKVSRPRE